MSGRGVFRDMFEYLFPRLVMACIGGGPSEGVCRICSHTLEHMAVEDAPFRRITKTFFHLHNGSGEQSAVRIGNTNPFFRLLVAI